jgi:hypothetical protein
MTRPKSAVELHDEQKATIQSLHDRIAELEGMVNKYKGEVEACFNLAQRMDAAFSNQPGAFTGTPSERLSRVMAHMFHLLYP